jgi:predicted esterase
LEPENVEIPAQRPDESAHPHDGQLILAEGQPELATVVLLHGRGGSAEDMLDLGRELRVVGLALIAPQAAGNSWYPSSFLSPIDQNQPYLGSALRLVESIVAGLLASGVPSRAIALLGFSQGACLATEYVARHPRRYGAVMGLTGGLIGPPGTSRDYPGSLGGTPVFLGANDPDPYIPFDRVQETEKVLARLGASVELRRYPGLPHTVNPDELDICRRLLRDMVGGI